MMIESPNALEPFTKSLITTYHDQHMLDLIFPHEFSKMQSCDSLDLARLDSLKNAVNVRLMWAIFSGNNEFRAHPAFCHQVVPWGSSC